MDLKQLIYVVESGSQHLDFNSPPGSKVKTAMYHEITKVSGVAYSGEIDLKAPSVVIFGTTYVKDERRVEIVEFSHKNIIAGVASAIAALPKPEQFTPQDIFIPADTLSDLFARVQTYAALSSGATLALNPVSGPTTDLSRCVHRVRPTVIVASSSTLAELRCKTAGNMIEMWHRLIHFFQTRTLTVHGNIPKGNFWTRVNDYMRPDVGIPSRLRLIITAEEAENSESKCLNSEDLSDLRIFLSAKVVYGLKSYKVAGPVCQQNVYDYRVQPQVPKPSRAKGILRRCAHFGGVAPGVEVLTKDWQKYKAGVEGGDSGEIVVRGLAVAGAGSGGSMEVRLGVAGKWWPEGVLYKL